MTPTQQTSVERLMWVLVLLAVVVFSVGRFLDLIWLAVFTKPLPVLIFAYLVRSWSSDAYGNRLAAGFVCSAVGDTLLEIPENLFVFSLASFFIAHVFYIAAFVSRARHLAALGAVPFFVWCGGMYLWMSPSLGDLRIPVAAYVVVIGTMMWRASALVRQGSRSTYYAFTGAVTFAFSDSLIAVDKFVAPIEAAGFFIMVTYWVAQLLLVLSAKPQWTKIANQ